VKRDDSIKHQYRVLSKNQEYSCVFSVCCLVTRWKDYEMAREAFELQGFDASISEFLVCDNSTTNRFDAYQAIRAFLREARGRYVVIAHQDAYPMEECSKLLERLKSLEKADPMWGIVGNAGVNDHKWPSVAGSLLMPESIGISLKMPHQEVSVLDENALIIRNGCGITVSADLEGYHLYGLDICSVAARLGYTSYALDYLWFHGSHGTIAEDFFASKVKLESKLRNYFSRTGAATTCTHVSWSPSKWRSALSMGKSLMQVAFSPRHKDARRHLWLEGKRNILFVPALLFLATVHGPRLIVSKIYRTAQRFGVTKVKLAAADN
jgi:hypothetical protein